jgi:hypothetical protein
MKTLILNANNVVPNSNNSKFQYEFPQGGYTYKDEVIAIQEIAQYFSTFNITTTYNNNRFSYIWVDGTVVVVNIPNSYMEITDINAFLQSVMVANGHYLIETLTTNFVYLIEIVVNQSLYAVQINNFLISATIATANGWTLPPAPTWVLPVNSILPYIVIPTTNNFGLLLGIEGGQYPAGVITGIPPNQIQTPAYVVSQSTLSTKAPQITPYSSFLVFCSMVNNRAVIPSQLIFSYTPTDATFGKLQKYSPNAEMGWNKIEDGQYTQFTIEFRDQLGRPISIQDPNTLITLYTKSRTEDLDSKSNNGNNK